MATQTDRQQASSFARLPTELISRIARPLTTTDVCSLRQTCKLVDHKLYNEFAFEFFRKKQFMMASPSLAALQDIAASRLGNYLRHLVIGTDQLFGTRWNDNISIQDKREFRAAADEQKLLGHVGGYVDIIKGALADLANLETIDIRDFNSPSRFRDGEHAQWRSYGAAKLGEAGSVSFGNGDWASCVFQNTLLGAAAAGVKPTSLEVLSRQNGCLKDGSLRLPRPVAYNLASLLSGLTKLHLDLIASWEDVKFVGFPNLCEFLLHTPNVTWLRLNFDLQSADYDTAEDSGWIGFLAWLAKKPPTTDNLIATYDTPPTFSLQRLDLGRTVVSPEHLLEVVEAYPALRTLSMQRVCLTEAAAAAAPTTSATPGTPRLVNTFLTRLDKTCVEVLLAKALSQRTASEGRGEVRWKNSRGSVTDQITLRSQPGRLQFKDAISLISFQVQALARELEWLVHAHGPEYYLAPSDDGSGTDTEDVDNGDSNEDSEDESEDGD